MIFSKSRLTKFDRWMMAITFAEAGEQEMALEMMNQKPKKKRLRYRVKKHAEERPVLRA